MIAKIVGAIFLLGALAAGFFAYLSGGPNWHEAFRFSKMVKEGGHYVALGALVCLVLGIFLLRKKKRATP